MISFCQQVAFAVPSFNESFPIEKNVTLSSDELSLFGANELIRCIIQAINDGVKETGLEEISKAWEEYKKDIQNVLDKARSCKSERSIWKTMKLVS